MAPALNSNVKLEINIPYVLVDIPINAKSEGEIIAIIVGALYNELWQYRRPRINRIVRDKR